MFEAQRGFLWIKFSLNWSSFLQIYFEIPLKSAAVDQDVEMQIETFRELYNK